MTYGTAHLPNTYSLIEQLAPDRFRRPHYLPDQRVEIWPMYLEQLRGAWKRGEETRVITSFIDYFNPADKPKRWTDWKTK